MAVAQLNARLDQNLKREGDATLLRYGVSTTDAIRALWSYLASAKELPSFMRPHEVPEADASQQNHATDSAGLAARMAREQRLVVDVLHSMSYAALRDAALEESLNEGMLSV